MEEIPTGDPLVSAHNELADLYSNYLKEREFDEERVKGILESSVARYPLANRTAARPDEIESLFSQAVSAIGHLQEIEIDPQATEILAKVAAEKVDTMCAQFNLSQLRRKEGRTTAYKSALQHVLYLNRIRDPMELQAFYYEQVVEKLKGKMQQWQAVLDGNEPEEEEDKKKRPRKSKAKKAGNEQEEGNGVEGDKENEESSVELEAKETVEEEVQEMKKKKAGGRGKRKAQDEALDANEDEAANKAPATKRRRNMASAAKNAGSIEDIEKKEEATEEAEAGVETVEKEVEVAKTPAVKRGRGKGRGKSVAKVELLDVIPKVEVKEEVEGYVADTVAAAGGEVEKKEVRVKVAEGNEAGNEVVSARTPATKRGRGRGKSVAAKAVVVPLDQIPKNEVKKEKPGDVAATVAAGEEVEKKEVRVNVEEGIEAGNEVVSARTPATKRGRGRGKSVAAKAVVVPLDQNPKTEVTKEEQGDDEAGVDVSSATPTPKRKRGRPPKTEMGAETPKVEPKSEPIVEEESSTADPSADTQPSPGVSGSARSQGNRGRRQKK